MRRPIIAGNWKMNTTLEEALRLVDELATSLRPYDGVERVVCPPFISLAAVAERLRGGRIVVGAQNAYFEDKGAFTGEVSPPMLVGLCEYVILGHSERRQYFGDTDEIVNRKIKAVLKHGLKPIVCVGENLAENEAGQTDAVIDRQVRGAFVDVPSLANVVIAYEPIWAIGTGRPATGEGANRVIGGIRRLLSELYGESSGNATRIQYGGSVTAANAAEIMSQPEIDGALVGGASLKPAEFTAIVQAAAK